MASRNTSTRESAFGRKIQTISWDDVLGGGLSKAAAAAKVATDVPGPGILIQGRLPNAESATRAKALRGESDLEISEAAEDLAGQLLKRVKAAVRGGARLELDIEGQRYCLADPVSAREIGTIEGYLRAKLEISLRRSVSGRAGARTIATATNPGDANTPGWLCPPQGKAADGRAAYAKGKAFEPKLAPGVWRVFEHYLAGDSMPAVANRLNLKQIPDKYRQGARTAGRLKYQPPGMGLWSAATVHNLLKAPATIGLHGGASVDLKSESPPTPVRPALLTWPTFRLVQDLLAAKLASTRPEAAHLLSGRLYCLNCRQDGRGETQLDCPPRKEGLQLRCQHKHKVPRYDAFEGCLLAWLQKEQDVAHELDDLLHASDEELNNAIHDFGWPPADTDSPASLEEAVLRFQAARCAYRSDEKRCERVAAFIESMTLAPPGERRNALRRKMRCVLRRHIDRVFVGDVSVQPLSVEERSRLTYLGLGTADEVFDTAGAVRPGARVLAVAVQRFGQAHADPMFRLALSSTSFELPADTDWEQILLSPSETETGTGSGRPLLAPPVASSSAEGGAAVVGGAHSHDASVQADDCRTGYQPSSASKRDKAVRPWGIHIAGKDLERTAREVSAMAEAAGLSVSDGQIDHFAFGLLLHSLEFFAKTDRWLEQTLKAIHPGRKINTMHLRCFRELRRADDIQPNLDDKWGRGFLATLIGNGKPSESRLRALRHVFDGVIDDPYEVGHHLQIMFAGAALHEVVRWAERRGTAGLPEIDAMAFELARDTEHCELANLRAFGQAFAHDWAWSTMANQLKEMLSSKAGPSPDPLIPWLDGSSLMAALQEHRFIVRDGLSAPVHLHGESRALDKIRSELGL